MQTTQTCVKKTFLNAFPARRLPCASTLLLALLAWSRLVLLRLALGPSRQRPRRSRRRVDIRVVVRRAGGVGGVIGLEPRSLPRGEAVGRARGAELPEVLPRVRACDGGSSTEAAARSDPYVLKACMYFDADISVFVG